MPADKLNYKGDDGIFTSIAHVVNNHADVINDQLGPPGPPPDLQTSIQEISFSYLALLDQENDARVGKIYLKDSDFYIDLVVGDSIAIKGPFIDADVLMPKLIDIVTQNTGRPPVDGEKFTFEASTGNIIWGS